MPANAPNAIGFGQPARGVVSFVRDTDGVRGPLEQLFIELLADKPAAVWGFGWASGTPRDISGNGNHLNFVGDAPTYGVAGGQPGLLSTGIQFDGVNDYMNAANSAASLNVADVGTYVVLVRVLTRTGLRTIVDKGANAFQLQYDGNTKRFVMNVNSLGGPAATSAVHDDATEYLVFMSKNGTSRKFVVNGVDETVLGTNLTATGNTVTPMNIGREGTTFGEYANIVVRAVAIFPVELPVQRGIDYWNAVQTSVEAHTGSTVAQVITESTAVGIRQAQGATVAGAVLAATSVGIKQAAAPAVGALATGATAAGRKQGAAQVLGQVVSGSIAVGVKGARAVTQLVSGSLATARKQAQGTVASLIVAGSSSSAFVPGVGSVIKGAVIALATSIGRKQTAASPVGGLASGATSATAKRASGSAAAGLASGSTSAGTKRGTGSITGLIASTSLVAGIGGRTGSGRGLVLTGTTVIAANADVLDRRGTVGASAAVVGGVGATAVPREGVGAGVAVLGSAGSADGVVGGVGGVVVVRDTVGSGTE